MNRRQFLETTSASAFSIALLLGFSNNSLLVDFEIREVRKGVFVYTNRGGTIMFKHTKNGWVVVDTQFPDQSQTLIAELAKKGTSPIGLLVNTHHHGDHSGGNIAFKDLVEEVVAHSNSLKNQKAVAIARNVEDKQLYPTTTFDELWSTDMGDENVTLRYFGAGHTDGDAWVHLENANVVHTGDMLFNRRHPYIDKSAGAMVSSWIEVLEKVRNNYEDDTKFVFGHSGDGYDIVGEKSDLEAFGQYLEKAHNFVRKKLKSGMSQEDVKAIKAFDFESTWKGDGIGRVLGALVEELS